MEEITENQFLHREWQKTFFLQFYRKMSILGYMLLHNSNINVAIAHILMCRISLYDPQEPKYKNTTCLPLGDFGRGPLGSAVEKQKLYLYDSGPVWHQKQ